MQTTQVHEIFVKTNAFQVVVFNNRRTYSTINQKCFRILNQILPQKSMI